MKKLVILALVLMSGGYAQAGNLHEVPALTTIPAGTFVMGSSDAERESAYRLDAAAYGHNRTRTQKWYDDEPVKHLDLPAFQITTTPITNRQYLDFVRSTGHRVPNVDRRTWAQYGLIHPYSRTRRFAWAGGNVPKNRDRHPVVLVSHDDAQAYAQWISRSTGQVWRLPTEAEWEKAARGPIGHWFPWGNTFDPARLNSHDLGPFDTLPVGSFPSGQSPYGMLDAVGQVYEWTSTSARAGRFIVKGGSWDDKGCGVCRPAAGHSRPAYLKHIIIGFRLVRVIPR